MKKVFFVLCGIYALAAITFLVIFGCTGKDKEPIINTDIDNYLQTDNHVSNFLIFPNIHENKGEVEEYFLKKFPPPDFGYDYEIFLKIKYTDSFFEEEIERLNSIVSEWSGKGTVTDDNCLLFNCFTIVSIYYAGGSNEFEYASIDFEKKEIAYVYIKNVFYNELTIDLKYLPKYYTSEDSLYRSYDYNMDAIGSDNWIED